jgi:hypothetical protein
MILCAQDKVREGVVRVAWEEYIQARMRRWKDCVPQPVDAKKF